MTFMQEARDHNIPATMEEAARSRLAQAGYRSLRAVTCHFRQGQLILRGQVPTYYQKQLAQESVRALTDAGTIVNEIEVSKVARI
jgi:osmotically-inducible protein OsmY